MIVSTAEQGCDDAELVEVKKVEWIMDCPRMLARANTPMKYYFSNLPELCKVQWNVRHGINRMAPCMPNKFMQIYNYNSIHESASWIVGSLPQCHMENGIKARNERNERIAISEREVIHAYGNLQQLTAGIQILR